MQKKKIILITGCSSGFGLLCAVRLCRKHIVYATMRNLNKSEELLKRVKQNNGKIYLKELDVIKKDTIEKIFKDLKEKYGKLDILINNAGFAGAGCFEDMKDKEFRNVMETNFFGVLNVTKMLLPLIHKSERGKIINISSIAGKVSYPALGAYNSSKYALEGFSESLRYELRPFNIEVLLVEPGSFKTKIFNENAKICDRAFDKKSKYYKRCQHFISKRELLDKYRPDPDKVAALIEKIVHKRKNKFRIVVGIDAKIQLFFKWLLPFSIFEKVVSYFAFKNMKK
ncbi:MAG: SDR family NAD(P)-dependent oxidoreductase [Candidatus Muiribacteriota bacterium]